VRGEEEERESQGKKRASPHTSLSAQRGSVNTRPPGARRGGFLSLTRGAGNLTRVLNNALRASRHTPACPENPQRAKAAARLRARQAGVSLWYRARTAGNLPGRKGGQREAFAGRGLVTPVSFPGAPVRVPYPPVRGIRSRKQNPWFPKRGFRFLKRVARFPKRGHRFLKRMARFPKRRPRFLKRGLRFLKRESRFLKRRLRFLKRESRFLKRESRFLRREPCFPKRVTRFLKRRTRFPTRESRFLKRGARFLKRESY
jgi:hypothetical protein